MASLPSARDLRLGFVLGLCGLSALATAHAQGDDLPATLPEEAAAPSTFPADAPPPEYADDLSNDQPMPATLPDDQPVHASDSTTVPLRFEATVDAALSAPLAGNPDVAAFGWAITYGVGWDEIPLALGVDFISVGSIGDAESQLDLELMAGTQRAERLVNTRLLHFDAWLRLQPAHFWLRPYAEGFFGAQLFQGKYVLHVANQQSDVAQAQAWGRSFGWGLGVEFVGLLSRARGMSLTLGMRRVYADSVQVSRPVTLASERIQAPYEGGTAVLLFMIGIGLHYELGESEP